MKKKWNGVMFIFVGIYGLVYNVVVVVVFISKEKKVIVDLK